MSEITPPEDQAKAAPDRAYVTEVAVTPVTVKFPFQVAGVNIPFTLIDAPILNGALITLPPAPPEPYAVPDSAYVTLVVVDPVTTNVPFQTDGDEMPETKIVWPTWNGYIGVVQDRVTAVVVDDDALVVVTNGCVYDEFPNVRVTADVVEVPPVMLREFR